MLTLKAISLTSLEDWHRGDLVEEFYEAFRIIKGTSKLDYRTFSKFNEKSRTIGNKYKLVIFRRKLQQYVPSFPPFLSFLHRMQLYTHCYKGQNGYLLIVLVDKHYHSFDTGNNAIIDFLVFSFFVMRHVRLSSMYFRKNLGKNLEIVRESGPSSL
jgi:hypothetical protein